MTQIPKRASSQVMGSAMATTPPLDTEYAAWPMPIECGDTGGVDDDAALITGFIRIADASGELGQNVVSSFRIRFRSDVIGSRVNGGSLSAVSFVLR